MQENWLLIDTTGQGCHVGLYHAGKLQQLSDMQPQSHTRQILPMIHQLLQQSQLPLSSLNGIIYTKGPGSFTGVRVGVSVVQGLSMAWNIPTMGVSTLMALAWQGIASTQHQSNVAAVLDARMGQIYWGEYCFAQQAPVIVSDCLTTVAQVSLTGLPELVSGDVHLFDVADIALTKKATLSQQAHIQITHLLSFVRYGLSEEFLSWDNGLALPIYLRNDVAHMPKK